MSSTRSALDRPAATPENSPFVAALSDRRQWLRDLGWAAFATLPFFSLYVAHFLSSAGYPTGFLVGDMAQYSALGREAFENGVSFLYPNAYDPDPASPAIYFHWFEWLHGAGVVCLNLEPGLLFVGWGIMAGLLFSRVTLALVDRNLPSTRFRIPIFLLSIWGGGVLVSSALLHNAWRSHPLTMNLIRYDPEGGWWFLNWGRNLVYSTEATYHLLMAIAWISLLDGRWTIAVVATALIAATHPYTGAQASCLMAAWVVIHRLLPRARPMPLAYCAAMLTVVAAFFAYNLIYLRQFPGHREVMQNMSLPWNLDAGPMVRAWFLVGVFAGLRVILDWRTLGHRDWFLMVAAVVSFLLANHEWFMRPIEPIHFTRGYIWMPLFLLGLPVLQRVLEWIWATSDRRVACCIPLALVGLAAVADNAVFIGRYWTRSNGHGMFLSADERHIFETMAQEQLEGVFVSPDHRLNFLVATYTRVRPYWGHMFYTPGFAERSSVSTRWFQHGGAAEWLSDIDLILAPPACVATRELSPIDWQAILHTSEWVLYVRRQNHTARE
jgi:hypothetical protein